MILDHIALMASDTDKTGSLYQEIFGAEVLPHVSEYKGSPETTLVVGEVKLVLVGGEKSCVNPHNHIAFKVALEVFEKVKRSLLKYDLDFQVVRGGSSLYFRDYDNYLFEINIE